MPTITKLPLAEIIVNRAAWMAALSLEGEEALAQTTGVLANNEFSAFCCLGVAPEKVPALGMCRSTEPDNDDQFGYVWSFQFDEDQGWVWEGEGNIDEETNTVTRTFTADLPTEILAKLGLTDTQQAFLIGLNDDAGLSFQQIAEVIDELPVYGASDQDDPEPFDEFRFIYYHQYHFEGAKASWYAAKLGGILGKLTAKDTQVKNLQRDLKVAQENIDRITRGR